MSKSTISMAKATRYVGIRLTDDDLKKLLEAAQLAWSGARMSQATMALREADRILSERRKSKK